MVVTRTDYTRISIGLNIYKQLDTPYRFAKMYIGDKKYKCISTKEKSKIKGFKCTYEKD